MERTITFATPMKIIVNTVVLLHDISEDYRRFLNEVLEIIIKRNGEHEFIIIADDSIAKKFFHGNSNNVTNVIRRYPFRHPLLTKIWCDLKLPAILKKYQGDLFVSLDGFCSHTTRLPQCVLLNDRSLSGCSSRDKRLSSFFYKRLMHKIVQRARVLVCGSDVRKNDLMLRYPGNERKINVVYPAAMETFQPLNELVKDEVRKKYCDEKNYFVYAGTIQQRDDLLNLLKAFSILKKRQKSNWRLVLTGCLRQYDKKFINDLRSYKYREDVVLAVNEKHNDAARLIGSAYALICLADSEGSVFPILQALKCQVPIIAADTPMCREITGEAALYINPADTENIADQMMRMYKDESLRTTLIEKGRIEGARYGLDKSADHLWQCICMTGTNY